MIAGFRGRAGQKTFDRRSPRRRRETGREKSPSILRPSTGVRRFGDTSDKERLARAQVSSLRSVLTKCEGNQIARASDRKAAGWIFLRPQGAARPSAA